MVDLSTRTIIRCPISEAPSRLAEYFARNGVIQGESTRITLEVDLPRPKSARRTQLTDDVVVTVRPVATGLTESWLYEVDWSLDDRLNLPAIAGRLQIEPSADYNAFSLCLITKSGARERADRVSLDAGTAQKIIKEVSSAILLSIAADIERAFRTDERAKLRNMSAGPRAPLPHRP